MNPPMLTFLIPVFNRLDLTRPFLRSLQQTVPGDFWEAIVIDDGSTDGTAEFLATLAAPFRGLRLETNGGFARAINRGAVEARGSIFCLLNNDLLLTPRWIEPMLQLLAAAPQAGAIGNVQVNPTTGLIDHAGVFFDPEGMPTHARKNRRRLPHGHWRERSAVTAACMLIHRHVFERMGGFCEEYQNGMEDIDLCVRLKQAGFQILVSHLSIIGHLAGSSPGRHRADGANTEIFRRRCAAIAAPWGRAEWPAEYLQRYARQWWRVNPRRAARALGLLVFGSGDARQKPIA